MSSPPPSYYALLRSVLSADRLDVYRQPRDADSLDVVARYLWNEALSEALYPTLAALEGCPSSFCTHLGGRGWPASVGWR